MLKHFERNPNIRSNLQISLLPRNQTNKKRKIFSTTSPNLSVFEYFHDSWRILASLAKFSLKSLLRNMIVPLKWSVPVTSFSALSSSSLASTRAFGHDKSLQTPFPVGSFSCASEVERIPHRNEMSLINT